MFYEAVEPDAKQVKFNTLSGMLTVVRKGNLYEMDFPTCELKEIPVTDAMDAAFGSRPVKAILGLDLICVFENAELFKVCKLPIIGQKSLTLFEDELYAAWNDFNY